MASINIISLSGDNFVDIGTQNILSLIVSNTDTEDITFDLAIGPTKIADTSTTTDVVFVLKSVPVVTGGTLVWDDDGVLSDAFTAGSKVLKFDANQKKFKDLKNNTFLIRVGSSHTADVVLKRK